MTTPAQYWYPTHREVQRYRETALHPSLRGLFAWTRWERMQGRSPDRETREASPGTTPTLDELRAMEWSTSAPLPVAYERF